MGVLPVSLLSLTLYLQQKSSHRKYSDTAYNLLSWPINFYDFIPITRQLFCNSVLSQQICGGLFQ